MRKLTPEMKGRAVLAAAVRGLRKEAGLSIRGLAMRAHVSHTCMSRVENRRQGIRSVVLFRIAAALGVRPWRLLMTEAEWKLVQASLC